MPIDRALEETLVDRAKRGETEAVAQLYEHFAPAIFRYLYFRVRDRATAEDLTGDVFVRMVQALPSYEQRGVPFAAWLYRVAHDRVVDHVRRVQQRPSVPLEETLPDGDNNTERAALLAYDRSALLELMQTLTDEQQLVLHLRFMEGCSLAETAALLDKTEGAVKALQHRALRQLSQGFPR